MKLRAVASARSRRLLTWAADRRLPRRTVRFRLTALYAFLFTAGGAVLLAATYLVVNHFTRHVRVTSTPAGVTIFVAGRHAGTLSSPLIGRHAHQVRFEGRPPPSFVNDVSVAAVHQQLIQMHLLLLASGISLAVVAALSTTTGWIVSGRMLRRLHTITATAQTISATSLHQRLALTGPADELKELGDTFDALLARLEGSFLSQRQFVANASHELRSPLARQRTLIEVALADPGADTTALRHAHERALAANAQQERILDALLTLARGQAGITAPEPVDLATAAGAALDMRAADIAGTRLTVDTHLEPAEALGDVRLIERLIGNLVDNAVRHNVPGGHLSIATRNTTTGHEFSVSNTGSIPLPGDVDALFEPFVRGSGTRTDHGGGHGLGLSIVAAIAEAHHAEVTATGNDAGGIDVVVSFPKIPNP